MDNGPDFRGPSQLCATISGFEHKKEFNSKLNFTAKLRWENSARKQLLTCTSLGHQFGNSNSK